MAADPSLLQALLDFGFERERAAAALVATSNRNVESALAYLLDEAPPGPSAPRPAEEEYKAVLVVVSSHAMGTGKTAAQAAHAAVGLYKELAATQSATLRAWEAQGEKTVVVSVPNAAEASALFEQARSLGLACHAVHDAGRTEVAVGAFTVLAVAGLSRTVDLVTGRLELLR